MRVGRAGSAHGQQLARLAALGSSLALSTRAGAIRIPKRVLTGVVMALGGGVSDDTIQSLIAQLEAARAEMRAQVERCAAHIAEAEGLKAKLVEKDGTIASQARALEMLTKASKPASTEKTLRQLAELYDATLPRDETWPKSVRSSMASALRHFGDRVADELTRADWTHYRDHVRAHVITNRKGPPTPLTINLEMTRWRTVYRFGKTEGHVLTNPLAEIKPLRAKKHRETEPSEADIQALRPHCSAVTWAFIAAGWRSGMRASEVRRLEWLWIDLKRGRVELPARVTKTRRARSVRLTSDAVEALRAIRPDIPPRYVFQSERTGIPVVATTLWLQFRAAADAAKLQAAEGDRRVVYHDGRHRFMSDATRRGVRLDVAMKLAGQTSLSAAQRYLHTNEKDLDDAQEKLEEAVKDARTTDHDVRTGVKVPPKGTG